MIIIRLKKYKNIFLKDLSYAINIFSLNIFYFILYEINLRLCKVKFYGWVS